MKAQTIGLDSIPSNLAIDLTDELSSDVRGGGTFDIGGFKKWWTTEGKDRLKRRQTEKCFNFDFEDFDSYLNEHDDSLTKEKFTNDLLGLFDFDGNLFMVEFIWRKYDSFYREG